MIMILIKKYIAFDERLMKNFEQHETSNIKLETNHETLPPLLNRNSKADGLHRLAVYPFAS